MGSSRIEKFTSLLLTELVEPEDIDRHGGYRYLVTNLHSSHTAFYSLADLANWMRFCGLSFGDPWDLRISQRSVWLTPGYREIMVLDKEWFDAIGTIHKDRIPWLSNGKYTKAIRIEAGYLSDDHEKLVTIIYLNPNVKEREEALGRHHKEFVVGLFEQAFGRKDED